MSGSSIKGGKLVRLIHKERKNSIFTLFVFATRDLCLETIIASNTQTIKVVAVGSGTME